MTADSPAFLNAVDESAPAEEVRRLEFGEVRMHGVAARRRTAHFGWRYGYESWSIEPGPPFPEFLLTLRQFGPGGGGDLAARRLSLLVPVRAGDGAADVCADGGTTIGLRAGWGGAIGVAARDLTDEDAALLDHLPDAAAELAPPVDQRFQA